MKGKEVCPGHGFCQVCWDIAYTLMLAEPKLTQTQHYLELVINKEECDEG